MKKLIIGGIIAIVIAGAIGAGAAFLTNSSSDKNNNSSNINSSQAVSGTSNTTSTQNTENNSNQNINSNNGTQTNTNNQNTTQSTSTTNNNTSNQSSFKMNLGTGNFNNLVANGEFIYVKVSNGAELVINLGSAIDNGQLLGTEYYINKPNEKFNVKISSLGGNKYLIYEFYNGEHTGTFEMNGSQGQVEGTYTHAGSNQTIGASYNCGINKQNFGNLQFFPFYNGTVGGTAITWVNTNIGSYIETYNGDSNQFTLEPGYHTGNYAIELVETYNGKTTGEYYLNYNKANNEYTGKYVKASNGQSLDVTIQGSTSPN